MARTLLRLPIGNASSEVSENPVPLNKDAIKRLLLKGAGVPEQSRIPLPDYSNPNSRLKYAHSFVSKYGPLMEQRGDTPLRVNERPVNSNLTSKEMAQKIGKEYGIDPALLYSGSMEEGMSGIYPGQKYLEYKLGPNKDYPIDALWSFGLDSFMNKQKDLISSGKLPKDFANRFTVIPNVSGQDRVYFKTPEDGMRASAAMLKGHYEDVDNYVKQKWIALSPRARDFFARIGFNAGEGTARQMISDYHNNNLLAGDAFMKKRPIAGKGLRPESYKDTYENVSRVVQMADALKKEGLFDDDRESEIIKNMLSRPPKTMLRISK